MRLYQRGKKWYADLRAEGLGRVATGMTDRSAAEGVAKRLILDGKARKTVGDALEHAMMTHYAGSKNWPSVASIHKELVRELGKAKLDDITGRTLAVYVKGRRAAGNSDSTISRKLSHLQVCFRLAIEEGWMEQLPVKPRLKSGLQRHREVSNPELYRLSMELPSWMVPLARFLLQTGARLSEALSIDELSRMRALRDGKWLIQNTKNGRDRMIPLTVEARGALETWSWNGRSKRECQVAWQRAREAMGLAEDPGFVIHALRHTCASRMLQGGVRLEVVSKWLGHSSLKVTERYAHLRTDDLAPGVGVLEGEVLGGI